MPAGALCKHAEVRPLAVILWLWFFIAVGVYLYRGTRWLQRRGDPDAEPQPTRGERKQRQLADIEARAEAPSPTEALFRQAAAERAAGKPLSAAPPSSPASGDTGAPGGLVLPATPPTTDGPGAPGASPRPDGDAPVVTVAQLLAGIDWPCDLSPVADTTATDLDRRVAFSTTSYPVELVAEAMRRNLAAIGYDIVEVDDRNFAGTSARGKLAVKVHADAAIAAENHPGWAGLPPTSVVVELTARS